MRDFSRFYKDRPPYGYRNFRYALEAAHAQFGPRVAYRMRSAPEKPYEEWSFTRLRAEALAAARWMASLGLRKGDRAGILAENRPEWCAAYFACVISGVVAVPIDAGLDDPSIAYDLEAGACKVLFLSSKFAQRAAAFLPAGKTIVLAAFDPLAESPGCAIDWAGVKASEGADICAVEDVKGDDLAAILFTSGTTGIAKGIMLTQRNLIANASSAILALKAWEDDCFLSVLPFHHSYAATCTFLAPLLCGASVTIAEKIIGKVVLGHVKDSKVSFLIGVPLLFDKVKAGMEAKFRELPGLKRGLVGAIRGVSAFFGSRLNINAGKLLAGSIRRQAGLSSVKIIVAGGGPLGWETSRFFDSIGCMLLQGYGMSENSPLISVNLPNYRNNRSVGVPVADTEVAIDSPGPDGVGEITCRSPSVMLGYLDNPEATAETVTAEGWLRTGDLGYIDRKGFIHITGRCKSLIVTDGGKNIYPEEIELKFSGSPNVLEVLVVGRRIGAGNSGEEVVAVCVPDAEQLKERHGPGAADPEFVRSLIRDEIIEINKTLPSYKKVQDFVVRETEFEKTSTKKIRRFLYAEYSKPVAARK